MKSLLKILWGLVLAASLVRCAPAQIVTTDTYVEFAQRGPGGTVDTRGARGDQNLWKVWGFDVNGHLAPLSISELITGSGYTFSLADGAVTTAKLADSAVTSAKIADGTVVAGDLADGAVTSAKVLDGTLTNADVAAAANIALTKLEQRVGTTWEGTTEAPITTASYSPTWTTETLAVVYGANGTINLPPISTYSGAALVVVTPGTFTVGINPNGTEVIWKNGAPLSAGADDSITGSAGLLTTYLARGGRWVRVAGGGGGVANLTPWTSNIDGGGFNLGNVNTLTATAVNADLSGSTNVPAERLTGVVPDLAFGQIRRSEAGVNLETPIAATTGATITVDTTAINSVVTLNEAAETIAYSSTPLPGTWFSYRIIPHSVDCTVTIPTTFSVDGTGGNRTFFVVYQGKPAFINVYYNGNAYYMFGDPADAAALPANTTPASSALIVTDDGTGPKKSTIAQTVAAVTNPTFNNVTYGSASVAALDIDWAAAGTQYKTLSANSTFTFSNVANGRAVVVAVTNTASNYTVTWPTVSWKGGVAPTQTVGAKTDIYSFIRINGVTYGSVIQDF
jgi:hypothetical protein